MRSTEEQLPDVLKRINRIKKQKTLRSHCIVDGISAAICLVLFITANIFLPKVTQTLSSDPTASYGSMILKSSIMGYVVIGGLAFLLGVFVTLLCYHLGEMKKRKPGDR